MLKNYLKIALRNLLRRKGFSLINILGLTVSMAVFIMISIFVRLVGNTDKFHTDYHRIYRVENEHSHHSPAPFGPLLKNSTPEIESFLRIGGCPTMEILTVNEKSFRFENFMTVDSNLFSFFNFKLIKGKPTEVLSSPDKIVLSVSTAQKLFGDEDPIGQSIKLNNKYSFQVSGVMEDFPVNSSIQALAIIPFNFYKTVFEDTKILENLDMWNYSTFLKVQPYVEPKAIEKKVNQTLIGFLNKKEPDEEQQTYHLTRLDELYFQNESNDILQHGNKSTFIIARVVSFIILILALINFVNLSTAQATYRASEIGIRKVVGAFKGRLIIQLLVESTVIAYISMILAAIIAEQALPFFSSLVSIKLDFIFFDPINLTIVFVGPLVFGILSGAYPAFYMSAFSPKKILSGEKTSDRKGAFSRNMLTVIQFTAAIALIIFTLHVSKQVNYFNTRDLGFEKENKLNIVSSPELNKNKEVFENEIKAIPNVISASFHAYSIGDIDEKWTGIEFEGKKIDLRIQKADSNYIHSLGIRLLKGRNINPRQPNDSLFEVLINEKAAISYGLEDAVGKTVHDFINFKIVGIISDFNYESLHKPLEPFMILSTPNFNEITINFKRGNSAELVKQIQKIWNKHSPNYPFSYTYMNQDLETLYSEESRLKRLFEGFTLIVVFIGCIGLLGLAIFTVGNKIKEIGIRKALGSTSFQVINLLLFKFIKLIGLSTLIAWPIAWWFTTQWFHNFIEPVGIDYWYFILAGILTTLVAVLTIISNAYLAANTNPATTLKHE